MKSLDSFVTPFPKDVIEWWLDCFRDVVTVVGSRLTEDGWELVLEGDWRAIGELMQVLGEGNDATS